MHRNPLLKLLEDYDFSKNEEICYSRFNNFVLQNTNCFERELQEGHVTGSAWIVDSSRKHVLLNHHAKLNVWMQFGGHCDGDSDVERVALKEAHEETGLGKLNRLEPGIFDLDIHLIPERKDLKAHYHYDVRFIFEADPKERFEVSHESHDLKWLPLIELDQFTTETSILRMRRKTDELSA